MNMGTLLVSKEAILLFALGIVFNAGGIVWLVLNHIPHTNRRLDRVEKNIGILTGNVSWIRGRLSRTESRKA